MTNLKHKKSIIIILIVVFLIMLIFQQRLDNTRHISMHCYIRNVVIIYAIWYLYNYKWSWCIFFMPFVVEFLIEFLDTVCLLNIDPEENKIKNVYYFFEKMSKTEKNLDYYTEGSYKKNPNLSMKKAQNNKFEWMCNQGDIKKNTRVLDIGSGRCDFLYYAKNKKNAKVTGCTISKDQLDICKKKNIDVFVIDIVNDPIPDKYKGKFDVIVLNGSMEHFRLPCSKYGMDLFWKKFFNKISVFFDPKSANKKIVITMIHQRRQLTFLEKINFWSIANNGFGGSFPYGKNGLVKSLRKNYKIIKIVDATEDYNLYSSSYGTHILKHFNNIAFNFIKTMPIDLFNDPYYIHKYFSIFYAWKRQFMSNGNLPPPMIHLWIVLKKIE